MRRFVIGDIHGAHRALVQCFKRSGFNKREDLLILLGDLCDGWPEVDKVLDELLMIQNLVLLQGNHDQWLTDWFESGETPYIWLSQGGNATIHSYKSNVPQQHKEFLKKSLPFYILDNMLFVHGGFNPAKPIEQQDTDTLLWDRSLVRSALMHRHSRPDFRLTLFDKVFVGHTPTINFDETCPIEACGVYLMDTGAGWSGGVLTIMDIDTGLFFSSDPVDELYQDFKGR